MDEPTRAPAAAPPSILNDVLGPVMRGPSSSHTAGSYHVATLAAALLGARPARALVRFDPAGSYAQVYREQGVDLAFAAGLLGWPLTDDRFPRALDLAPAAGLDLRFDVGRLDAADHPNAVHLELEGGGRRTVLRARSVGGGAVQVTEVDGWPVLLTGQAHAILIECHADVEGRVREALGVAAGERVEQRAVRGGDVLLVLERVAPLADERRAALTEIAGVRRVRGVAPVAFANRGTPLFRSGRDIVALASRSGRSLGRLGLAYEAHLLQVPEAALLAEMTARFEIMRAAVHRGLSSPPPTLHLLVPAAAHILRAEAAGHLAIGGLHTRAAARAMAVMHVNGAMGVVLAAPTGGSAGVLPGVLVSLVEERGLSVEDAALGLFAAGAVGLIVATRATFAAEVAGCQVEIGAAGAMAAAAVVDGAGGAAAAALNAAAIAFQNTMGSVCDLVQGRVEIPCHTRNAVAASSAFVCADLVLGGYANPIPLDETIDAVLAVGKMLPAELRCTAKGGLAVTPSALRAGLSRSNRDPA